MHIAKPIINIVIEPFEEKPGFYKVEVVGLSGSPYGKGKSLYRLHPAKYEFQHVLSTSHSLVADSKAWTNAFRLWKDSKSLFLHGSSLKSILSMLVWKLFIHLKLINFFWNDVNFWIAAKVELERLRFTFRSQQISRVHPDMNVGDMYHLPEEKLLAACKNGKLVKHQKPWLHLSFSEMFCQSLRGLNGFWARHTSGKTWFWCEWVLDEKTCCFCMLRQFDLMQCV